MAMSAEALIVLLLLSPNVTARAESNYAIAQAGKAERTQSDYKQRMDAAKTPEEKAKIQEEGERMMREGASDSKEPQPLPGTSGGVACQSEKNDRNREHPDKLSLTGEADSLEHAPMIAVVPGCLVTSRGASPEREPQAPPGLGLFSCLQGAP